MSGGLFCGTRRDDEGDGRAGPVPRGPGRRKRRGCRDFARRCAGTSGRRFDPSRRDTDASFGACAGFLRGGSGVDEARCGHGDERQDDDDVPDRIDGVANGAQSRRDGNDLAPIPRLHRGFREHDARHAEAVPAIGGHARGGVCPGRDGFARRALQDSNTTSPFGTTSASIISTITRRARLMEKPSSSSSSATLPRVFLPGIRRMRSSMRQIPMS